MNEILEELGCNQQIKLIRPNDHLQEFVISDGLGKSGKIIVSRMLESFKRVEKFRLDILFDNIPRIYMLGKISHDAAVFLLQLQADLELYSSMISREANFRFKDQTSVFQTVYPLRYLRRLFMREGDVVVDRIRKERPIFHDVVHDGMTNARILFDAFGEKLWMFYILRNPIDLVYEWNSGGFGERIGTDSREFQFTYEWKGKPIPLDAYGWEDEYLSSNPIERIIGMLSKTFYRDLNGYYKLSTIEKFRVMFISFDELANNPMPICEKSAIFLKTETTSRTKKTLKRQDCPRYISQEDRLQKRRFLEKNASDKYQKIFNEFICEYDTFIQSELISSIGKDYHDDVTKKFVVNV